MAVDKESLIDRAILLLDKERERLTVIDGDEEFYTDIGVFESQEDVDVMVVKVPDGRDAVDLMSDMLGSTFLSVLVPAPGELVADRKRAEAVERWLSSYMYALDQYEDSQFVASCVWDCAVRGALVLRSIVNTESGDSELPILLQLRDYRNVFPVWRGSRLVEVFEGYDAQVIDLRLEYSDITFPKEWNDSDYVTVFEYWSATHKAFWCGYLGEGARHINSDAAGGGPMWLQEPTTHEYGVLPYSIRIPRGRSRTGHRSILGNMGVTLRVLGKLESALLTTSMGAVMAAWTLKSERGSEASDAIDLRFNKVNPLEPDEELAPITRPPLPKDVPVSMELWGRRLQKQSFPDASWGEGISSQMSGYAINILQASGTRILAPIVDVIEKGTADSMGIMLAILANVVIPHDDEVSVSYFDDDENFWIESTLKASDVEGLSRVKCSLSDPMPQDQDRAVGVASAMRQPDATGRPLLSTQTIYEKILDSVVEDPAVEAARIDAERMGSAMVDAMTQDVVQKLQATLSPPPPPVPEGMGAPTPGVPGGEAQPSGVPPAVQPGANTVGVQGSAPSMQDPELSLAELEQYLQIQTQGDPNAQAIPPNPQPAAGPGRAPGQGVTPGR